MYEYDELCLNTFLKEQAKLLGRDEITTIDEAHEFLEDSMAMILNNLKEVRDFFEQAGMDAYGLSDEELLSQAEVFSIPDGRYLVVDC